MPRVTLNNGPFYDSFCKIAVVGEENVGKTNVISRFARDEFNIGKSSYTPSHETQALEINGKIIQTQVFENNLRTERNRAPGYGRGISAFILVIDLSKRHTFTEIGQTISCIERCADSSEPNIIIFGNKCDVPDRVVSKSEIEQFARNKSYTYMEGSALEGKNIVNVFETAVGQAFPSNKNTKDDAETLAAIFSNKHKAIFAREKKGLFGFFKSTTFKESWNLEDILTQACFGKTKSNRTLKICKELGWLTERNGHVIVNSKAKDFEEISAAFSKIHRTPTND